MGAARDTRRYLSTPEEWAALARRCREAGLIGLDSEYHGVGKNESCVGRARIHVWSVAIRTERMDPRGYHRCAGWLLPAAALRHPDLVAVLEDPGVTKAVHNQGVDIHAFANHGITIRGALNTLGYVRWKRPDLINSAGRFRLKALMSTLLGREPVCNFADVVADTRVVATVKTGTTKTTVCECGEPGCRKRKGAHAKLLRVDEWQKTVERTEEFDWDLTDIVPGHPKWELLKAYAIEDAVAALQVMEVVEVEPDPAPHPTGRRGEFCQGVEDAFTAMEAVGFHRDLEFCTTRAAEADGLEEKELEWLFRWYVANSAVYGPHSRRLGGSGKGAKTAGVDAIWSSPVKLLKLFDDMGFPRAPIWKKGRVKPGEVKLDEVALDWIGKNEPGATKLVEHIIHLKRIRSGRKYLVKLRDHPGDLVHIIAGPAGDEDERAGAVTGRASIKGPLEAQQLPQVEEKDLFGVRKAIVARDGEIILTGDYSSLELGVQAEWCKRLFDDDQLLRAYADQAPPKKIDLHSNTARGVFGTWLKWTVPPGLPYAGKTADCIPVEEFKAHPFGEKLRGMTKTLRYGLAYGKSDFSTLVGANGEMIGPDLSRRMVEAFMEAEPYQRRWFRWVEAFVRKHHGIYSLGGRWCDLSSEMSGEEWQHRRAFRRAYNFPMQATGADIIGDAMVRVTRCPELARLGYRLCLQIHDELVLRGPVENLEQARELLVKHMVSATANGVELLVRLQVNTGSGRNYWEAK